MNKERDYVLGTHDEELARLGLQHRVWRPVVLDCWRKAGITVDSRVSELQVESGERSFTLQAETLKNIAKSRHHGGQSRA